MLFAMFRRHMPAGNWVVPLVSGLAVLILAAIAVYVLSSVWRDHAGVAGDGDGVSGGTGDHGGLSAAEILDRRLAAGEITIAEYEQLAEVLGRRHAAAAGAAAVSNGAATTTV
jgi:uncharacterized membrane protein